MNQIPKKQENKTISLYLPVNIAEEMATESEAVRISRSALILLIWEKHLEEKRGENKNLSQIIGLLRSISDRLRILENGQTAKVENMEDQG